MPLYVEWAVEPLLVRQRKCARIPVGKIDLSRHVATSIQAVYLH